MDELTKEQITELYPILSRIDSPDDLKALGQDELDALAAEIRAFLVHRVSINGGHLASNLGVVELTLAIHRVFSTPKDHLIFDVGHQSYVHKLLTGRRDAFETLRRGGGISGFPKRSESEHDCFGAGHSSTSLSAALGFAQSDRLTGSDAHTVCIFGDGAYTGGMIHEALNNCSKKLNLIIIINENEMSISKNIGRFAKSLSRLRSTHGYFRTKNATVSFLEKIPLIGKATVALIRRVKIAIKNMLYGSNYFENLGLYYFGPIDGNDEAAVERLLQEAKATGQSCVIHVKTKKGKGYALAEENPNSFHGVAPSGKKPADGRSFSAEMGAILTELATENPKICAITAAMADGTGLCDFAKAHPDRFFDVGIAEAHAVTFAAGLAANGQRPVAAIYSTFLQRAYDNILHDVALQNLPVVFCVDRAGLNASDGATHHGIFDVAFLSHVPNLRLYTPITRAALRVVLENALQSDGPVAIRYPNGCENPAIVKCFYRGKTPNDVAVRKSFDTSPETLDSVIVTHGRIAEEAIRAAKMLAEQGHRTGILLLEQITPVADVAAQISALLPQKACKILFLEEEIRTGGMGMILSDALRGQPVMQNKRVIIMATEDFGLQNANEPIYRSVGLDAEQITARILQ
jgi:1-deoxy-D-xylulose-5-phosphate synthase